MGPRGARPRRRRRAAPTGSRWPAATARRRSSRRSPPSTGCPTRASLPAPATTSRSTSASTATTSSARSTRSSTAASARVDLAEVNGRVFVNNVSLGVYAEAVQRSEYRDAKLRTLLDTVPDALGPTGEGLDLRWTGPGRPRAPRRRGGAGLQQHLPARPRHRLGDAPADRRRPARRHGHRRPSGRGENGGGLQRPMREWSAPTFEVDSERPVPAGIDGEALRARPAAEVQRPPRRAARAHRAPAPGRLALGESPRAAGRIRAARADRPRHDNQP